VSRPTALHYMEELGHLGVVSVKYGISTSINLNPEFNWLIKPDIKESGVVSATA